MNTQTLILLKKISLIILITGVGLNSGKLSANPTVNQDSTEILLIGSSYFNFNDLAGLLEGLADSSNTDLYIEMHGQNGLYLSDHASSPETEAKINERDWDHVVLQGCGILMAYPEDFTDHPVYPALITLRDKIYANCESTRMVFCMPWAFEDGMTWYQGWTDTFEDMQIHIYDNTLQYSDEIGFEIAPVGWAWYAVLEEYDYPLHYLHMNDWNHPSLKGSYLMACVIYSAVFQESTVNNPFHSTISEEEADFFQVVASDTVLNNLERWNITPLTSIDHIKSQKQFHLEQNFPNPLNQTTEIRYTLAKTSPVRLIIIDNMGIEIATLVDEKQIPGTYSVKFDASILHRGIYHYQLTAKQSRLMKTMIVDH